jgi:hypothetical protein
MSTREQPDTSVPLATPAHTADSRFRRWARRRTRQLLSLMAILAVVMVAGAAGVMFWRASRLFGLPDIGDPFDVAAFRVAGSPVDAYLPPKTAVNVLPMPELPIAVRRQGIKLGWSQPDPKLREWLEANRDALLDFRQRIENGDETEHRNADWRDRYATVNWGPLFRLSLVESSRLEEKSDLEGAWGWYRTVLRMRMLLMLRGSVFQRWLAERQCEGLGTRIESWAANRKTGVPLLRRALKDVLAGEPRPEWDAGSLKLEYLRMKYELDQPDGWVHHGTDEELDYRLGDEKLPPNLTSQIYAARRFVLNDPEVSRRALALAFANWIAHAQDPDPRHRQPVKIASFVFDKLNTSIAFFSVGPEAPGSAKNLQPADLASRLLTARDAKALLLQWQWPSIRIGEKREHAKLVLLLAEQLYRREHGNPPRSDQELVGPYLDHLPDDGSDELPDGSPPRVHQSTGQEPAPD